MLALTLHDHVIEGSGLEPREVALHEDRRNTTQKHLNLTIKKDIAFIFSRYRVEATLSSQSMRKAHRTRIALLDSVPYSPRHSMSSFYSLIEVIGGPSIPCGLRWPSPVGWPLGRWASPRCTLLTLTANPNLGLSVTAMAACTSMKDRIW